MSRLDDMIVRWPGGLNDPRAVAKLDQQQAALREVFEAEGVDLDDPVVARAVLLTLDVVVCGADPEGPREVLSGTPEGPREVLSGTPEEEFMRVVWWLVPLARIAAKRLRPEGETR